MRYLYFFAFLFPFLLTGQNESEVYRSEKNPYYWKNRKPHAAYWQQDVHYDIKAKIDDKTDIVDGEEELTYWNNSPDELPFVYFHLYSNAQTKDSYLSDLYRNNNYKLKYGKYRKDNLGTEVEKITANGTDLKTEKDNTVMKVWLSSPLKPGESVTLKIKFKTYFDAETIRNRMKMFSNFGYKQYDLVHWYPRISVYDRKFGWDTEQHMDHEFYGDFGSFHVELDLPNNYIGDGTGILINEPDVLPIELREKIDLANYKTKPWNSPPEEVVKADGTFKTWKFSAVNVHDVAYTFDPTYRIGEAHFGNVRCIALAQEPHAGGWQTAPKYTAKIVETNSRNIGMFAYPKMIVADAMDGMEYPMLTLDGGYDPTYRSLFTHEISHNWFFGMVGSNETYRPFMDEGFTQFYTSDTWENIEGPYDLQYRSKSNYVNQFTRPVLARESEAYGGYYNSAVKGEEHTLNTHGDGFNGAIRQGGGYGQVYTKTATMLYNLKYVLGDSLFVAAMKNYFNQWKMCHPYPEDFRNSMIQFTKADLNWFFDEWLETYKTIDYAVTKIRRVRGTKDYKITFKRIGGMQMPIDFTVFTKDSLAKNYYIPNTWFEKKTNATVLPRWIGWDKVKKTYTARVTATGKIVRVAIDTTNRLADINYVNNAKKRNVSISFDSKIWNAPDRTKYEMFARPSIWYNGYDGLKVGAHVNGSYMNYKNVFDATLWFNTGYFQGNLDRTAAINSNDVISFLLNYKNPTDKFMKKSSFYATIKELDGLSSAMLGFDKRSNNDKNRVYIQVKSMLRDVDNDLNYLIYKDEWQLHKLNNYVAVGLDHNYSYKKGTGVINVNLRAPAFSDYDFSALSFSCVNKNNLGKIAINTRFFMQVGTGNYLPYESQLYVAGANPEELMDNKYTRSQGFFAPFSFGNKTNNFAAGGGLNLRGYMGYLLPEVDKYGNYQYNYKGTSGASFNAELEFAKLIGLGNPIIKGTFKVTPYLFGDAGTINNNLPGNDLTFTDIMADAGAGVAVTIQKWWKLQTVKPLTIRFDSPFFINRLPYEEKDYFQFRWMIGVNRAF